VDNLCIVNSEIPPSDQPFQKRPRAHHVPDKGTDGKFLPSENKKLLEKRPRLSDQEAQRLIDEWFAFKHETYSVLALAFGISELSANALVLGHSRPHLDRPADRVRFQPRNYSVKVIMEMVSAWDAGSYKTKKELGEAFGIPRHMVSRLLNGMASTRLPRLSTRVGFKSWGRFRV
jgi:hypothetical protein